MNEKTRAQVVDIVRRDPTRTVIIADDLTEPDRDPEETKRLVKKWSEPGLLDGTKRRHTRPRDAGDPTLPIFEDLPPLIWCPYKAGHYTDPANFGRNKSRVSGLQTYCKACRKLRSARDRKRADRKNLVREMRRLGKRIEKAVDRVLRKLAEIEERARKPADTQASVPRGNPADRR